MKVTLVLSFKLHNQTTKNQVTKVTVNNIVMRLQFFFFYFIKFNCVNMHFFFCAHVWSWVSSMNCMTTDQKTQRKKNMQFSHESFSKIQNFFFFASKRRNNHKFEYNVSFGRQSNKYGNAKHHFVWWTIPFSKNGKRGKSNNVCD